MVDAFMCFLRPSIGGQILINAPLTLQNCLRALDRALLISSQCPKIQGKNPGVEGIFAPALKSLCVRKSRCAEG